MIETQSRPDAQGDVETVDLLGYLEALLQRRAMIMGIAFGAAVLSLIVSLLLPKTYIGTAKVLPPQQEQSLSAAILGQLGGGLGSIAGGMLGKGTIADTYVGILQSESIKDVIIDRFHLMEVYEQKYRSDTYKALDKRAHVSAGPKDGIVTVAVEDRDPKRAADIANAFIDELAKTTVKLSSTGAGNNRNFLQERLAMAKGELAKAEEGLKAFQAKHKALDVPEQARASLTGIAELRAQLAAQEVLLATLRRTLTESSQEVRNAQTSTSNIRAQIARLEGQGGGAIPSVGSVPALGQEYIRLMREFKIQEALVEFLTKQYEAARLTESKDVSSLQILQRARTPDKKAKPKRALVVALGTAGGCFLGILLASLLGRFERLPEEDKERWRRLCRLGRNACRQVG